jgi:hypothetical protein
VLATANLEHAGTGVVGDRDRHASKSSYAASRRALR